MQDLSEFMEAVTVKRFVLITDEMKARPDVQETSFNIMAIVQPLSRETTGNVGIERTTTRGTHALGEILVMTSSELLDGTSEKPDVVVYYGKQYEVCVTKHYKEPLEHFEYICQSKI